jgi:hypothetical protein
MNKMPEYKLATTINIVHLADSTKNKDSINK